jgi:hypothetical protein
VDLWSRKFCPVERLVPENDILSIKRAIESCSPCLDQSLLNIFIIQSLKIQLFLQAHTSIDILQVHTYPSFSMCILKKLLYYPCGDRYSTTQFPCYDPDCRCWQENLWENDWLDGGPKPAEEPQYGNCPRCVVEVYEPWPAHIPPIPQDLPK